MLMTVDEFSGWLSDYLAIDKHIRRTTMFGDGDDGGDAVDDGGGGGGGGGVD